MSTHFPLIQANQNVEHIETQLPDLKIPKFGYTLPHELFLHILSYLTPKELQEAVCVNREWNIVAIDAACRKEFRSIQSFIGFFIGNLGNHHPVQTQSLIVAIDGPSPEEEELAIVEEQELNTAIEEMLHINLSDEQPNSIEENTIGARIIFNSMNMLEAKSSIIQIRETILNILKNLDDAILNTLSESVKNERAPLFFEHLFSLVNIYKKIDINAEIEDLYQKSKELVDICSELMEIKQFDKAVEIANTILNDRNRASILIRIIKVWIQKGNIYKATEVANSLPDVDKSKSFKEIANAWLQKGNLDKANEVANTITDAEYKSEALKEISNAWIQKGDLDKATEAANTMPNTIGTYYVFTSSENRSNYQKIEILQDIVTAWIKRENLDKATEVANIISDDRERSWELSRIIKVWIQKGNINKAHEIANIIPNETIRLQTLQVVNGPRLIRSWWQ